MMNSDHLNNSPLEEHTELTGSPHGIENGVNDNRHASETLMSLLSRGENLMNFINESKKSSTTTKVQSAKYI
jgi:hypothetical protein